MGSCARYPSASEYTRDNSAGLRQDCGRSASAMNRREISIPARWPGTGRSTFRDWSTTASVIPDRHGRSGKK